MLEKSDKYNDIINLPHHVSEKHVRMTIEERSAQFAPFSALTGYDDVIKETARETNSRIEINEEQKTILNKKLLLIKEKIHNRPKITVTYFIPDVKKDGGKYIEVTENVVKIDEYDRKIILENGEEVQIEEIIGMSFFRWGLP